MDTITKAALIRAARAFAAGAIGTMAAVPIISLASSAPDWGSLANWCSLLVFSGIVGGISGVIQGVDKWIRG